MTGKPPTIPNQQSLIAGVLVTLAFTTYLVGAVGYEPLPALFIMILGIPVAFLFLMYNNPVHREGIHWGTVLALPFCCMLWPVLLLALLAGQPWKEPRWKNRNSANVATSTPASNPSDGPNEPGTKAVKPSHYAPAKSGRQLLGIYLMVAASIGMCLSLIALDFAIGITNAVMCGVGYLLSRSPQRSEAERPSGDGSSGADE